MLSVGSVLLNPFVFYPVMGTLFVGTTILVVKKVVKPIFNIIKEFFNRSFFVTNIKALFCKKCASFHSYHEKKVEDLSKPFNVTRKPIDRVDNMEQNGVLV